MLAPAGNRVQFGFQTESLPKFDGYSPIWCQSGTAALALSILVAKQLKSIEQAEVIIPGYACPDLVSACAFANTKCRLSDLEISNTAFSLEHIESVINDRTIAIVAVNFLGIEERLAELKALASKHNILLIEDNAQWWPEFNNGNTSLSGDCISISFGRGKPISMLGGGLTLISQTLLENSKINSLLETYGRKFIDSGSASFVIKSLLYNALINPALYGLLNYVPGLKLGQTNYKPLQSISEFEQIKAKFLGLNISKHISREPTAQLFLQTHLENLPDEIISLPNKYLERTKRLLRFPILFEDQTSRDHNFDLFNQSGLGASKLYNNTLPNIPGTEPHLCEYDDLPNALDFANRLLTLPVHSLVKQKHLDKMLSILKSD